MGHAHAALRPIGPCVLSVQMSVFIIRHTYLGFLLDEALSGSAHFDRAIARGAGFTHKVGKVSSSMGEDMGLWYLQSVVGPSCLYDIELVGQGHDLRRLKNVWERLLSKATLVPGAL